jgi:hypothetical protein
MVYRCSPFTQKDLYNINPGKAELQGGNNYILSLVRVNYLAIMDNDY